MIEYDAKLCDCDIAISFLRLPRLASCVTSSG